MFLQEDSPVLLLFAQPFLLSVMCHGLELALDLLVPAALLRPPPHCLPSPSIRALI